MEEVLNNLSPIQQLIIIAPYIWMFIVFPAIIIKKLNYMTALLEAQFEQEEEEA